MVAGGDVCGAFLMTVRPPVVDDADAAVAAVASLARQSGHDDLLAVLRCDLLLDGRLLLALLLLHLTQRRFS